MWLMACGVAPDSSVDAVADDSEVRTEAPDETTETLPGTPPPAGDCADVFDGEISSPFALDFAPEDWDAFAVDYHNGLKNYHPGVLTLGAETVAVQVRLKGNPSFSWFQSKMQFVVSFNEDDPDGRFHGLRKLAFDAPWYDESLLRDRLAWSVLTDVGAVPDACTATVTLDINGERYGAYTLMEYFDHEWLERNFGDEGATGALWKYGTEVVANEEAADGDGIFALNRADTVEELDAIGPTEEWAAAWAGEAALGDDDGYWCCDHNYYLYEHPTRGVLFVPWDLDDTLDVMPYDADPVEGYPQTWGLFRQDPFVVLTEDPVGRARYRDALAAVRDAMDPAIVHPRIDAWGTLTHDPIAADPMRPYSLDEHEAAVERLKLWFTARHAWLDAWLSCDAGTPDDADGDGSDDCADPDDADPAIHPGAPELCDGRDNDANGIIDDDLSCDDCVEHSFEGRHYAFCRTPRPFLEAEARCEEAGLHPLELAQDADTYYLYFYAWPVQDAWFISQNGDQCRGWSAMSAGYVALDCAEPHPVVCAGA